MTNEGRLAKAVNVGHLMCLLALGMLCWLLAPAQAQSSLVLTSEAEFSIGIECPAAQALSPDGKTLWVLMAGCVYAPASLIAFSIADETVIASTPDFSAVLAPLRGIDLPAYSTHLTFVDDQTLSLYYADTDTYQMRNLRFTVDAQPVPLLIPDDELADLLSGYTEYPESTIFSDGHTLAAVTSSDALTVLDLATGDEVLSLPIEEYNAFPSFSADGQRLYVGQLVDFENYDSSVTELSVFNLGDGSLLASHTLPGFLTWISPDERYAAIRSGANDSTSEQLTVVELATGAASQPYELYERPRQLLNCTNDGRSMADVDVTISGRLMLVGVSWLEDGSLMATRSYGGQALGPSICTFDTSRLNRFRVQ